MARRLESYSLDTETAVKGGRDTNRVKNGELQKGEGSKSTQWIDGSVQHPPVRRELEGLGSK